jgi:hypothetical protein
MNARFALSNDPTAPGWAAQIVQALLTAWGCSDSDSRAGAAGDVAAVVGRVQDHPAPLLTIDLRHANGVLTITVGAYQRRALRPEREEKSSSPIILDGEVAAPVSVAPPPPPAIVPLTTPPRAAPRAMPSSHPAGPVVTLADLAQRFEESAWFLRRRVAAGTLPPPDGEDDAGDPIWHPQTLDAWRDPAASTAARSGGPLSESVERRDGAILESSQTAAEGEQ